MLLTLAPALAAAMARFATRDGARHSTRIVAWILFGFGAVLLLRPHEDTLVGLDLSCYRNMARAFAAGRSFHGPDRALAETPIELRRAFLMKYRPGGRDTRDRSFEIRRVVEEEPRTNPWFYPSLPLLALGLGTVSAGTLTDYGVPLLGVLAFAGMIGWTRGRHGIWGLCAGFALWFGTPLLIWTLRGYFPEMAALSLMVIGALTPRTPARPWIGAGIASWLLGLAVTYHPLGLAVATPLLFFRLCEEEGGRASRLVEVLLFALGILPLVAMTHYLCKPYGDFLQPASWLERIRLDSAVRWTALVGALGIAATGVVVLLPERFHRRLREAGAVSLRSRAGMAAGMVIALAPLILGLVGPWRQRFVRIGFQEFGVAVQGPLSILLAAAILIEPVRCGRARERIWVLMTLLLAPLFFYLKGVDQMGMWSQRRLAPLMMLASVSFIPPLAAIGSRLRAVAMDRKPWRLALPAGWGLLLLTAALANPLRWPAPWRLRSERGADRWLGELRAAIGGHLAIFDYEPFSSPLSVLPDERVYGVNGDAFELWPEIIRWLRERAASELVWLISAWSNPGLEQDVVLIERGRKVIELPILRSRNALPAEAARRKIELHLLRPHPLSPGQNAPPLDKRLDGGPLALRGPWDRLREVTLPDGTRALAQWTRQGSGILGPVPPPGGHVIIEITASSGRRNTTQTLRITPPWQGPPAELEFAWETETRIVLVFRPAEADPAAESPTGVYRFASPTPYNPADEGLRGYAADLGALLHRIRIAVASASSDSAPPP